MTPEEREAELDASVQVLNEAHELDRLRFDSFANARTTIGNAMRLRELFEDLQKRFTESAEQLHDAKNALTHFQAQRLLEAKP